MFQKISLSILALFIALISFSQKGTLRGTITELSNGEPMPFVNVYVKSDVTKGTTTGFEGHYTLKLAAGTYQIVYSSVSYREVTKEVTLKAGETVIANISMSEDTEIMSEVEIVAEKRVAKTIAAFDRQKMKSTNMIDGTSSEQMKKTGDSDAGEIVKRVTGVSVEEGKYVYVRGLGDRYTKTILNGMIIPGLDPDRNTIQMNIFPTKLIDNITVYKTFTPELPGDYTGGLINIQTKDFPNEKTLNFSAGMGYNTVTTFNPNFISYNKGKFDALGFDDGGRKMPVNQNKPFADPTQGIEELTTLTQSFSPHMAVKKAPSFLNQSYSFGIGNQYNAEKRALDYGYTFNVNYQNNYQYYNDVQYNAYRKETDSTVNEIYADRKSTGELGIQNVIWSALLGQSIKINKKHKISLNLYHTQNGESRAASLREVNYETNPATLVKQSLKYTQRSISNLNLSGKHSLAKNKWNVNWAISPSIANINNPDIRSTVLEEIETDSGYVYKLNNSVGGEIRRIYRNLNEINLNSKIDLIYSFKLKNELESNLKFGIAETFKQRSYRVFDFIFDVENTTEVPNNPDWFFESQNIWTVASDKGTYGDAQRELSNSYDATQVIYAGYIMNELPITTKLKTVYGIRTEKVTNKYTGRNNNETIIYDNSTVLDQTNFLPALNLVYLLKDSAFNTMNLRASYTQTVARPSFKEKSIAQIYDPIQGRRFNGNIDLMQTNIHNGDLRWEYFYGRTEVLSVSGFYKKFINPIEIISFDLAPNEVKPINTGEAEVYGIELESRKRIGFKQTENHKLYIGANFTWVKSKINMNKVIIDKGLSTQTEREIRQANARQGQKIGTYRQMSGQSPYIINAYTSYSNDSLGLSFNLSYNIQGRRLSVVGIGALPDVYEKPFNSLNLKISKRLGQNWKASFKAQNILNSKRAKLYESYKAKAQIYNYYNRGRTFKVTLSYLL